MTSRRILITSFGSFGDVFPYIGLALGLKERGHRPVLAMPPFYRTLVKEEGIDFAPVRPDVNPHDRETVARIMDARRGTEFIIRDIILRSLRDTHADLVAAAADADLVVSHPITFAAPVVAQHRGIPWASTVLAPMSFFSAHDLPVFAPAPWMKKLERIPGAAGALVKLSRTMADRWVEPVYRLRRELGLPRGGHPVFEGQFSPDLVLGLFSRVLAEPQPDWPDHTRITGGIAYNGPQAGAPLSPELEAFLSSGPAPVVFTLGSSAVGAAGDFYEQSVSAVRQLGVRAILLAGPHAANRPASALPDGVLLVEFAPHALLFPRAAVVVHQGGAGTLHQGLRAGKPTLVVPFAHDQPDNAYRVERLGVSRTLPAPRYRASRVVDELRTLLEDDGYGRRAEEVATIVRREDGVAAACDALEALLGERCLT